MQNNNHFLWVNHLRSTITILVVAHHAALAYTTFSFFDKDIYIRSTHPIVDNNKNALLDVFVNFNDLFFMQLMFLIGGLFITKSILKKGNVVFFKDRLFRLAIPFFVLGTISNLIAYYPAYQLSNTPGNLLDYIVDFFTIQNWPVGPPWFIWLLFVFNCFAILLAAFFKRYDNFINNSFSTLIQNPVLLMLVIILGSCITQLPFIYLYGPYQWTGFGPFDFQLSRVLVYFFYFILGTVLGFLNFNKTLFSNDSIIVNKWKYFLSLSLVLFVLITIDNKTNFISNNAAFPLIKYLLEIAFCATICIATLACYKALYNTAVDSWKSLSDSTYLIYFIHYPLIIWLQYFMLQIEISALTKFTLTLVIGASISWFLSIQLRRVPLIYKYL